MNTGRLPSSHLIALVGAVILVAGTLAVPGSAGAAGPHGPRSFKMTQRTPVETGRITAEKAQRLSRAHPRPERTSRGALARPDRFAGSKATAKPFAATRSTRLPGPTGLLSTRGFDGIASADVGDLEPPDPWVAVNSSYVVQSTNGLVRISDRAGNEKASIATWAMFNVWPGYVDADPRITWDAYHGRWVGALVWFDYPDFSDNYLTLIVSQSSDPLGAWDTYTFWYENYLPDYPGIASSTDKLVITANEFIDGETYAGSSLLLVPWSALLSGSSFSATYAIREDAWNLRPGRVHGTAADLHLVYEDGSTETLWYLRIKGSATSPLIDDWDLAIPNGTEFTLDPRQPGDADGISRADDGRIADAVWRSNRLWFSRTIAHAWNGTDPDMAIEVIRVDTSTTAAPTVGLDSILGGATGVDEFTSGIGISNGGTAFVTYSQSSAAQPPSVLATAIHPTLGLQDPILLATSAASYGGSRWGDYAGISADPSGSDAVWQTHEVSDADGLWRTVVSRLVLDVTAPSNVTAPTQALITGTTLGSERGSVPTVPVKVSWSGSDGGSGIRYFDLSVTDHGSGWATAVQTPATSTIRYHTWKQSSDTWNSSYKYGVVGIDDGLNASSSMLGPTLTPIVYQQTTGVTYGGTWKKASSSSYSGGSVKYSTKAGAWAKFTTSGRSFAFVTTRSSSRGKVKVYVGGKYIKTLKLTSSTTRYRNLAYVVNYSSTASHAIKLVVVKGRVDIDAFVVLK